MKIGGPSEFERIRKAMQKQQAKKAPVSARTASGESAKREDEVELSSQAKLLGKLREIPDIRAAEIEKVLAKLEDGTLMTPEAVKESVANLLENLLGGTETE